MKLYILRHAIAGERDEDLYPDDSLRPLTAKGKKKMTKIAGHLKDIGVELELIVSSPYVRALDTAKIVFKTYGLKKKQLVLSDHLAQPDHAKELIAEINNKYQIENLMLVGHEPYLSELIAMLIAGDPSLSILVKKGGLCRLSIDQLVYGKCAILEWLLVPSQLIKIGK